MPFPEDVIEIAFARANGRCECYRQHPPHNGKRCETTFEKDEGWAATYKTAESAGGPSVLSNCEALCTACHQQIS